MGHGYKKGPLIEKPLVQKHVQLADNGGHRITADDDSEDTFLAEYTCA